MRVGGKPRQSRDGDALPGSPLSLSLLSHASLRLFVACFQVAPLRARSPSCFAPRPAHMGSRFADEVSSPPQICVWVSLPINERCGILVCAGESAEGGGGRGIAQGVL